MKKINLIIIAFFSLALIACGGEEKEDKKSKNRCEAPYTNKIQKVIKNIARSATTYYLDGNGTFVFV